MPEVAQSTPTPQGQLPLMPAAPVATAPAQKPVRRFEIPDEVPVAESAPAAPTAPEAPQNTGEQAPPATPEGEAPEKAEPEVTPEQAAKREGRRFERRLDKAYRKAAEAQARAEFLEKQLNEARQQSQPKAAEGAPTLEQFEFDPEKYAQAVADHKIKQAEKDREARQRDETTKQERQKLVSSWEEKADKGLEKYDDWTDIVGELAPGTPITDAIMDADNGHDIAHYLGKNPKEAERISKLPWRSQIREIGKLESKLAAVPEKPKAPSKAPAPITPVSGAATVANDVPSDNDDMKSWIRKRQKQVHGR